MESFGSEVVPQNDGVLFFAFNVSFLETLYLLRDIDISKYNKVNTRDVNIIHPSVSLGRTLHDIKTINTILGYTAVVNWLDEAAFYYFNLKMNFHYSSMGLMAFL
ncbi:unnamed protein product [Cuscuta europaea]|uniref:Uncharacterized protein n=1 Tax=Cuscuta europaea TaxID=41803 RepID=A0A9P1E2E8_CUSEU|nr:unnamed protein product [Cuscuta europaea]